MDGVSANKDFCTQSHEGGACLALLCLSDTSTWALEPGTPLGQSEP